MEEMDWQDYKLEIARLYLEKKKTLADVMKIMEETHGFKKPQGQYLSQFDRWGFKKYHMGAARLAGIKRKLAKVDGDDYEVYVDRIWGCPKKLMREANRQVFTPLIETFNSAPSPKTPEGVVVCSPGPSTMSLQWPDTLPWFQFCRMLDSTNLKESIFSIHQPSNKSKDMVRLLPQAQKDMLSFLGSMLSWKTTGRLESIQSSSRLAAVLSVIMPEEKEGDHLQLSEKLCKAHSFSAQELLQILLFIISNNLNLKESGFYSSCQRKDKLVMQLFHLSGLNNVQNVTYLLSQPDATSEAVVENLFGSALRTHDASAIQLMLRAGTNPDMLVHTDTWGLLSPLAVAASIDDEGLSMQIAKTLTTHGADLNSRISAKSPFSFAIERSKCELLKFFLSRSKDFPHQILHDANMNVANFAMVQLLLEAGMDIESLRWYRSGNRSNLVGMSVQRGDIKLLNLLASRGANLEAPQRIYTKLFGTHWRYEWTTALGLAAAEGSMRMLQALLSLGAQVNPGSNHMIPPLILVIQSNNIKAARLLLAVGANVLEADCFRLRDQPSESVGKTVLSLALKQEHTELLWILLKAGSKPSQSDMAKILSLFLKDSIKKNKIELVSRLISMGARVNTWDTEHCHNDPLALAIAQGNCEIISLLSNAGGRLTEHSICSIADVQTANYLKSIGLLPSLLHFAGRQVLISAILLEQNELAMTLLEYDADQRGIYRTPSSSCQKWALFKTPLEAAICRGNLMFAEILISRGASITEVEVAAFIWRILESNGGRDFHPFWNALYSWQPSAPTAVGMALKSGDHALVHRLLDAGVDPRGRPLDYDDEDVASWIAEIEAVQDTFVLDDPECAMVAGWWNCPLTDTRVHHYSVLEMAAASVEDQSILKALLKYAWTSEDKGRAFTTSLWRNKQDHAQILLLLNADVNQCITKWSMDCCHIAPLLTAVERRDLPLMRKLIAAGCDVNLHLGDDENSSTILGAAVMVGDVDILKDLLAAGALVNSPCDSTNALNISVEEERLDLVEVLLEAGAKINNPPPPYHGRTALQLAVEKGNLQLIEFLIREGADVNQSPALNGGATALQLAAIHGFMGIARRLIDLGANVNAPGARFNGRTALEGAAEHGHVDTVRLLLESGASVEGDGRKQYWRAVLLAEENAAYATVNFLKPIIGWTDFDSMFATKDILKDDDIRDGFVTEMMDYFD